MVRLEQAEMGRTEANGDAGARGDGARPRVVGARWVGLALASIAGAVLAIAGCATSDAGDLGGATANGNPALPGTGGSGQDAGGDDDPRRDGGAGADAASGKDAGKDSGGDASGGDGGGNTGLDPDLELPAASGAPCTAIGATSGPAGCPLAHVCRIASPTGGRCETCTNCGNLNAPCSASDECDIVFQCFKGKCTNLCPLGTSYCGPVADCLDVGHGTYGVCKP